MVGIEEGPPAEGALRGPAHHLHSQSCLSMNNVMYTPSSVASYMCVCNGGGSLCRRSIARLRTLSQAGGLLEGFKARYVADKLEHSTVRNGVCPPQQTNHCWSLCTIP